MPLIQGLPPLPPYTHQEFPKWLYSPGGESAIVNDPQEAESFKGWSESPNLKPEKSKK